MNCIECDRLRQSYEQLVFVRETTQSHLIVADFMRESVKIRKLKAELAAATARNEEALAAFQVHITNEHGSGAHAFEPTVAVTA